MRLFRAVHARLLARVGAELASLTEREAFAVLWRIGANLARGCLLRPRLRSARGALSVGRGARITEPGRLSVGRGVKMTWSTSYLIPHVMMVVQGHHRIQVHLNHLDHSGRCCGQLK